MIRTTAASLPLALAYALVAAPAVAQQRPPLPDEQPPDFDAAEERYSEFWERALAPHKSQYDEKVARAEILLRQTDPREYPEAEALLREAIELTPGEPRAYWLLGELYERQRKWQACADMRAALFALDPGYHPSGQTSWQLDRGLGHCLAHAGEYERAIDHYKRILASGGGKQSFAHLYLGMTYLAVGRVDDAIEALEAGLADGATNPRSRVTALIHFAAAVAYDRNGMRSASSEHMGQALRIDRTLSAFTIAEAVFAPPEEELYYRGLAEAARERDAWAIAYFRQYLEAAGDRAWERHARAHLDTLTERGFDPLQLRLTGSAVLDRKKVQAAVARHMDAMEACMAPAPNVLFSVRITVIAPGAARAPSAATEPTRAGVAVRQQLGFETKSVHVLEAQSCVEEIARKLQLPKPSGSARSYATVELWLIAR